MLSAKANADVGPISKIDTICDFLEVYIHAILYNRNVYPKSFFEDRYAYGIPVKASRHPELNQYVAGLMDAIKLELHKCESPGDVKIDIIDDNDITIESFVLELSVLSGNYVAEHDIALRETLIRTNNLDPADSSKSTSFRVCYRPQDGKPPSQEKVSREK